MKHIFDKFRFKAVNLQAEKIFYRQTIELTKLITSLEKQFVSEMFILDKELRYKLALLVLEFGEDLHNDATFWNVVEQHNLTHFNTPLPLFLPEGECVKTLFDVNRFKFFIYTIQEHFEETSTIIPPHHPDLALLASHCAEFCEKFFSDFPKVSAFKMEIEKPSERYDVVKNKLVMLGVRSYLFRTEFLKKSRINQKNTDIVELADEYLCETATSWSGMWVIDVLLPVIKLPLSLEKDVENWKQRVKSIFKLKTFNEGVLTVENVVNNEILELDSIDLREMVPNNAYVFSAIVPFDGFYYWSGSQSANEMSKKDLETEINDFCRKPFMYLYRFDKEARKQAAVVLEDMAFYYSNFFRHDWVYFENEADKNETIALFNQYLSERKSNLIPKVKKFKAVNKQNIPTSHENCHLYFCPGYGTEVIDEMSNFLSGLAKKGNDLTDLEKLEISQTVLNKKISPEFILRAVKEFGNESIARVFLIDIAATPNYLSFLLRKYKGNHYGVRYPNFIRPKQNLI